MIEIAKSYIMKSLPKERADSDRSAVALEQICKRTEVFQATPAWVKYSEYENPEVIASSLVLSMINLETEYVAKITSRSRASKRCLPSMSPGLTIYK